MPLTLVLAVSAGEAQTAPARRPARRPAPRPAPPVEPWWANDPRVVRRVDHDAAPRAVLAGDAIALPVPVLPAALPDSLRRRGVRWSSEATAVATVDSTGRVAGVGIGETVIHAWTAAGETRTPVTVRGAVRGRVRDARGAPVAGARVVVRPTEDDRASAGSHGGWTDTVRTSADGTFRLPLPTRAAPESRWQVALLPPDPGLLHPATLRAVPASRTHALDVVLLPTRWTFAAGALAGTAVPVRVAGVVGLTTEGSRFWRLAGPLATGVRPVQGTPVGWDAPFPLRVALARADDTPADRAALAAHLGALGAAWGTPLARLAPRDSAQILVSLDAALRHAGDAESGWEAGGTIASGHIRLRGRAELADRHVVQHEFLHALGFGHTTAWPSVLAPAGYLGASAATASDVAHAQLGAAVRRVGPGVVIAAP